MSEGRPQPPSTSRLDVAAWRVAVVRGISRLPRPARTHLWRARRALSRLLRRRREARGDWARSRPALHDMDRKLDRFVGLDGGFFVEAGANDGYQQSNTYNLERMRGWRGVLVEPIPELAGEARRERPHATVFNCALVADDFAGSTVRLRYGGLLTTVEEDAGERRGWVAAAHAVAQEEPEHEFETPARTLSSVLDEAGAGAIDLLSLDVEGYEASVLRGLDLDRHAPRFMLLEVHDEDARRAIEAVIGGRYRVVEWLSPIDLLYARDDQSLPA